MTKTVIFVTILFFLFINSFCFAENQDRIFFKVELNSIDDSLYVVHFCLPNNLLNHNQVLRAELAYGNEINKNIEILLAENEKSDEYKIFEVIFNKNKISKNENIYLRFIFIPSSINDNQVVLYYNMSYILSSVSALKETNLASCSKSVSLAPARIGGESVPAKM